MGVSLRRSALNFQRLGRTMVEYFAADNALKQTPLDFKWHSATVNPEGFTLSGNDENVTISSSVRFVDNGVKVISSYKSLSQRETFSFEHPASTPIANLLTTIMNCCELFGDVFITHKIPNTRIQGALL